MSSESRSIVPIPDRPHVGLTTFEAGSPVTDDYTTATSRFNGKVNWVELDAGAAAEHSRHYIDPEGRLHIGIQQDTSVISKSTNIERQRWQ